MVLGKAVVVAMEAVAALHVASGCVELVFEAVDLRLSELSRPSKPTYHVIRSKL